jgi:hypothetical protein
MNYKHALELLVLFFATSTILEACAPKDSTDSEESRSGMALHIDNLTGCHYLGKSIGGLTPRLDKEGKQICHVNLINY